jgi:hypothetical protein
MEEISEVLEAEEAYQTFQYLQENAQHHNVHVTRDYPQIEFLNDRQELMKEIIMNGTPDDQEILEQITRELNRP